MPRAFQLAQQHRGLCCSQAPAPPALRQHALTAPRCKSPLPDNRVGWQHKLIRLLPGPRDFVIRLCDAAYLELKKGRPFTDL
ncbi:MAG: hypothetical protein IGS03_02100 [Candidatus Sericytochromatia bacterium]|nr:hypothetical protein [Candidatus Sericytochromatia bacterium]